MIVWRPQPDIALWEFELAWRCLLFIRAVPIDLQVRAVSVMPYELRRHFVVPDLTSQGGEASMRHGIEAEGRDAGGGAVHESPTAACGGGAKVLSLKNIVERKF